MADSEPNTANTKVVDNEDSTTTDEIDTSLETAIETYKKIYGYDEKEEKEQKQIDQQIEIIRKREIITLSEKHEVVEIQNAVNTISSGRLTLTRFEKARIMGSRALQLSLGAPPFIDFSKNTTTSLEIAMEELKQRVIPIVIRRTLPNGDYQNIPIEQFE
jgi:DNA-directed RNA polymerase I, II, and III subunit RPABC2